MNFYTSLAEAFRYPAPGQLERLERMSLALPPGEVKTALGSFLEGVRSLDLGEWEELYTRTWDLSPITPPYIGFQIWGEDYRRGTFLARLQRAYRESGVDAGGELQDHLVPVLTYLEAAEQPAAELVEVFHQAVGKMAAVLRQRDPENPYQHLLYGLVELKIGASLQPAANDLEE